ncbi:MAG: SHOCT domain-containing protein [Arenicellales bacterium]
MSRKLGAALILVALFATGCASVMPTAGSQPAAAVNDSMSAEFKNNLRAPADAARVYVLPTFSTGLYRALDGRAGISLYREGSESVGATLGQTTAHSFIAFDVAPGSYDFYAKGHALDSRATSTLSLEAGKVYFLRPVFYRSAKDLAAERANGGLKPNGLDFDSVRAEVARTEIAHLDLAPLTPDGTAFLKGSSAPSSSTEPTAPVVAAPAPASAPAPAGASQAQPKVIQDQAIEKRLEILRDLYNKGLINKSEYDTKRKALLDAF